MARTHRWCHVQGSVRTNSLRISSPAGGDFGAAGSNRACSSCPQPSRQHVVEFYTSCEGQLTLSLNAQMILWYHSCRGISTGRKPCEERLGRTDSRFSLKHKFYRHCSESSSGGNFVSKSHSQVTTGPQLACIHTLPQPLRRSPVLPHKRLHTVSVHTRGSPRPSRTDPHRCRRHRQTAY